MRRRSPVAICSGVTPVGDVLAHGPGAILHPHIRNHLALDVGGDVLDLVRHVHVPVDAGGGAEPAVAPADVQPQRRHRLGVLLVVGILDDAPDLVAVELLRPVALLAGVARRRAACRRRRRSDADSCRTSPPAPAASRRAWPWRTTSRRGRRGTRRTSRCACGWFSCATNSGFIGVWHTWPQNPTDVHVLDAAVRAQRDDDDVGDRQQEDDERRRPLGGIVEVDPRPVHGRGRACRRRGAAARPRRRAESAAARARTAPGARGRRRSRCRDWCGGRRDRRERPRGTARR